MSEMTRLRDLLAQHTIEAAPELVQQEEENAVRCLACCNRCYIEDGDCGFCKVRFNRGGKLRVPGGYVAGLQADPIEKKPLFHAFPGRDALSFGMLGCDMHCDFCQNWISSHTLRDERAIARPNIIDADSIAAIAVERGTPVVVSTYNEPLITSEWAMRIFEHAREKGLTCGYVSNGNATPEVLEYLRPVVDLYKVDLKTFDDQAYRSLGASLKNILDAIERLKALGFWVEIVTLVVPGFNDDEAQLRGIAKFIAGLSPEIPWHVTAFHPDYKRTGGHRTTAGELCRAYDAGKEAGLHYVYSGNLPGAMGDRENTYCPSCHALLIERRGFFVLRNTMDGGQCGQCGAEIAGVWEAHPPTQSDGERLPRALGI